MSTEIGYHVVSKDALEGHEGFEDQMSVIKFLRLVRSEKRLPLNITVGGLDKLLHSVDNSTAVCKYIHMILADGVNHLTRQQPVVRFVVDEIEYWDEPVIPHGDDKIPLKQIFYGGLIQEDADWYYTQLNITS